MPRPADTIPTSDAAREAARVTARALLDIGAVTFRPDEPFTFTSGRVAPTYVDCRRIISFPRARAEIMRLAVAQLDRECGIEAFDAVAGGETAGIPFAAWIAEAMGLPMLYVRKQAKGFGRMAQIEGEFRAGARVLLVEDLATDGGSKVRFIDALRKADAVVAHTWVVFHYGIFAESTENIAKLGVKLHALATFWDVLEVARAEKRYPPASLAAVESYLDFPNTWQAPAKAE